MMLLSFEVVRCPLHKAGPLGLPMCRPIFSHPGPLLLPPFIPHPFVSTKMSSADAMMSYFTGTMMVAVHFRKQNVGQHSEVYSISSGLSKNLVVWGWAVRISSFTVGDKVSSSVGFVWWDSWAGEGFFLYESEWGTGWVILAYQGSWMCLSLVWVGLQGWGSDQNNLCGMVCLINLFCAGWSQGHFSGNIFEGHIPKCTFYLEPFLKKAPKSHFKNCPTIIGQYSQWNAFYSYFIVRGTVQYTFVKGTVE